MGEVPPHENFRCVLRRPEKCPARRVADYLLKDSYMKIHLPRARRLRATAAFSLMEVTISMGVLGLAVSILFNGLTTGFFTIRMARENLRATQIMLEKAETLRLYSWNQITNTTYIKREFTVPYDPNSTSGKGAIYQGTIEIEPADISADYSDDLKQVTIRVSWKTGGLSRSREFRSLVSRHGMQDYIYGM